VEFGIYSTSSGPLDGQGQEGRETEKEKVEENEEREKGRRKAKPTVAKSGVPY